MLALGISAMMYFFFAIAEFDYKNTANQNIAGNKDLNTIKIALKDLHIQKGNDELWYAGQLYDISSYTVEGDSAVVVLFHDEHEESLVKSIADNFESYDKYVTDNGTHIVKHRIHIPDDSKILVDTHTLTRMMFTQKHIPLPYFTKYASPVYSSILKPPPRLV